MGAGVSSAVETQGGPGPDPGPLARRIAAGDAAAEHEFIQLFQRGVRALVRRHARPGDPAVDDMTQSILQGLLERLRRDAVEDLAALPAYIRNTVVFSVRAEYRRRAHRETSLDDAVAETLADTDTPERVAQREQLRDQVQALLAELPVARDREILRLHYLAEEDRDQVCERLQIDASHFHRVLFRARERLRKLLEAARVDPS